MQHLFRCFALDLAQRHLAEQRDGILVELTPASWVQIAKQADTVGVPTPPDVARQGPEPLLCRRNKTVQRARLADYRRHLAGRLRQHANFVFAEGPRFLRLNNQHSLQNAAIDQWHAQKRTVLFLTGPLEVLEARMASHVVNGYGNHLLRDQASQALVQWHAQRSDAARVKTKRGGQNQVRTIRLQQIGRAHVGSEPLGDQCHYVRERIGRLAPLRCKVRNLLQGEYEAGVGSFVGLAHKDKLAFRMI